MRIRLVARHRCVKELLASAVAIGLAMPLAGQPRDSRNAAAWYTKAVERFDAAGLTDADWHALRAYRPASGDVPTPAVRDALQRLQPAFRAVQRGSRQAVSDFDLDYTQGFGLTLPHLGSLRNVSDLMAKDAMVRLHDGDSGGASESIAALYRVGSHVTDDGVLISSLVGQAIFNQADRAVQAGIDRSAFGPAESESLLKAVDALDERDPFDVIGALGNEQEFVVEWIREKYEDAGERQWMLEDLGELGLGAEAATVVSGMMLVDQAHFDTALEETDEIMGRLVDVFELDDAQAAQFELEQIAGEIERGEHGPLAAIIVPNVTGVHKRMIEAQAAVADRKAMLQTIVDGEVAVETLANGAVWYLRAVEMIRVLPPEANAELGRIARDHARPLDEDAAKHFTAATPIIDMLRDGSLKQRCDFAIAPDGRTAAIPPYLPGLRDAARILHADAVRHLRLERPAEAADRLAICFRLSAHLAGDRQIPSSLTAHVIFNRTLATAEWAVEAFDTDQLAIMQHAATAMDARDPFGYQFSQGMARREIIDALRLRDDAAAQAFRDVRRLDGDHLLYMVVVTDRDVIKLPETEPLGDVISLEALALALTEIERVRAEIAESGDLEPITDREVPDIGRVRERFGEAQSDLRKAWSVLKRSTG